MPPLFSVRPQCVTCGDNCSQCSDDGECAQCEGDMGEYKLSDNLIDCEPICDDDSHCESCANPGECAQCEDGMWPGDNGECTSCDQTGCGTCNQDDGECEVCDDDHTMDPNTGDCVPNCDLTDCNSCSTPSVCEECEDGFFINDFNLCEPCSDLCAKCEDKKDSCSECKAPAQFLGGKCHNSCTTGGLPNCVECDLSGDENECTKCDTEFYPSDDGEECLPCGNDCQRCPDLDICTACDPGYELDEDGEECIPSCSLLENCEECSSPTTCI